MVVNKNVGFGFSFGFVPDFTSAKIVVDIPSPCDAATQTPGGRDDVKCEWPLLRIDEAPLGL
jgi:hypothetical protein